MSEMKNRDPIRVGPPPSDYAKPERIKARRDAVTIKLLKEQLKAARARLDELTRLGREMREAQKALFLFYPTRDNMPEHEKLLLAQHDAESAFDAALSPGDNAAGL